SLPILDPRFGSCILVRSTVMPFGARCHVGLALRSKRRSTALDGCARHRNFCGSLSTPLSQLYPQRSARLRGNRGETVMITDRTLFKAIEAAIASGNTVYLISPDHQPTDDGSELITNCTLIKGKRGTFPADVFRSANSGQFLRTLGRYAQFKCEACR